MATATKKKAQIPEPKDDRLQYIYTDSKGNNYFEFIHDASMPYKRYVDAQVMEKQMRLGLTANYLTELVGGMKKISIDGTRTAEELRIDILTIAANIEGRLGYITSPKTYEQFASIFYLLEDEPIEPSDRWYLKKIDLWSQDEEARSFFLLGAFRKISGLMNESLESMMLSFKAAEIREQNLPTLPKK